MTQLHSLSISELRSGLDAKKFSAVEVVDSTLAACESAHQLNAFVQLLPEQVRESAKLVDQRISRGDKSPLLGIPVPLKDNILSMGSRSTCGSRILKNFESPYDATVAKRLKDAGALIVGKTNLDEFCMGSSSETSCFGPVKNPWDLSRVPGGTSGGSTAAVAAELVTGALGSDTGGSIRQPASFCGVTGIKPTYGRVSRYGVIAYASSLDQVGTIARSALDSAHILQAISGKDPFDSTSVDIAVPDFVAAVNKGATADNLKGLRVGVPKEYFISGLSREVESAVRSAIDTLKKEGATIVEISLPHTEAALAVYYVIAPAEASSNLARYDGIRYGVRSEKPADLKDLYFRSRSSGFGAEVKRRIMVGTYVLSTGYYDAYYRKAQQVRTLVARDFANAFTQCDVIACPAAPTTAYAIGEKIDDPIAMYLGDAFTIPASLAGLPGISLPCGFDSQQLPIGMQLLAKPWDEETLFHVSGKFQSITDWHQKRPGRR